MWTLPAVIFFLCYVLSNQLVQEQHLLSDSLHWCKCYMGTSECHKLGPHKNSSRTHTEGLPHTHTHPVLVAWSRHQSQYTRTCYKLEIWIDRAIRVYWPDSCVISLERTVCLMVTLTALPLFVHCSPHHQIMEAYFWAFSQNCKFISHNSNNFRIYILKLLFAGCYTHNLTFSFELSLYHATARRKLRIWRKNVRIVRCKFTIVSYKFVILTFFL